MPADLGFIDLSLPKGEDPPKEITAGTCYYLVGLKAAQVVATMVFPVPLTLYQTLL